MYGYEYNPDDDLWDEAREWAYQRAAEEGDVDIDKDYTMIEAWMDEYYRERKENSYA